MSTLSKFGKIKTPRSHDESRAVVCCVCSKKLKVSQHSYKIINERWSNLVRKFVFIGYSTRNPSHPTALCDICRLTLSAMEKVLCQGVIFQIIFSWIIVQNPQNPGRKLPPLFDYQNLVPPPPITRSTLYQNCPCTVCTIARKTLDYQKFVSKHVNPMGFPPTNTNPKSPPAKVLPFCSKCFSEVGQGKPHQCLKSTKRVNLSKIVRDTFKKSKSHITASSLKNIASDLGVSTRGGTLNLKTGGKSIPVQVGKSKIQPRHPHFSHENLKQLQTANNLSDRSLL